MILTTLYTQTRQSFMFVFLHVFFCFFFSGLPSTTKTARIKPDWYFDFNFIWNSAFFLHCSAAVIRRSLVLLHVQPHLASSCHVRRERAWCHLWASTTWATPATWTVSYRWVITIDRMGTHLQQLFCWFKKKKMYLCLHPSLLIFLHW